MQVAACGQARDERRIEARRRAFLAPRCGGLDMPMLARERGG
jgi:hypothetical protein